MFDDGYIDYMRLRPHFYLSKFQSRQARKRSKTGAFERLLSAQIENRITKGERSAFQFCLLSPKRVFQKRSLSFVCCHFDDASSFLFHGYLRDRSLGGIVAHRTSINLNLGRKSSSGRTILHVWGQSGAWSGVYVVAINLYAIFWSKTIDSEVRRQI